ncbi:hypothetical protein RJ639_022375 [Escallonia herrerae]|uniref:MADS-box domain-containing protein n=1 Tax=Escallonia herrerae TaxID=1293975 RepID=A0AA88V795_9ASTE|nr:hypothetical protein RJ639_022375 [Escallonia herrerae]
MAVNMNRPTVVKANFFKFEAKREQQRYVLCNFEMGRSKLTLERIKDEKARLATLERRKNGLKKKAQHLAILCDVEVGMIYYAPKQNDTATAVEIWPEDSTFRKLVDDFRLQHVQDRKKRALDLSNVFEDQRAKLESMAEKLRKLNDEVTYPIWGKAFYSLSEGQLRDLNFSLDRKVEFAKARIEWIRNGVTKENSSKSQSAFMPSWSRSMELEATQPSCPLGLIKETQHELSLGIEKLMGTPLMTMLVNNIDSIHQSGVVPSRNFSGYYDPIPDMVMKNNPGQPMFYFESAPQQPMQYPTTDVTSSQRHTPPMSLRNNPLQPLQYYDPTMQSWQQHMQYSIMAGTSSQIQTPPISGMVEHTVRKNPRQRLYYNGPTVQPMQLHMQHPVLAPTSSQVHAPRMEDYYEVIDFLDEETFSNSS